MGRGTFTRAGPSPTGRRTRRSTGKKFGSRRVGTAPRAARKAHIGFELFPPSDFEVLMSDVSSALTRETEEHKRRREGSGPHVLVAPNGDGPMQAHSTARSEDDVAVVERLREARDRVKGEVGKVVVGQEEIIDSLLIGLLCRGHILLFGVPGLGKTLMGRTLARTLDMDFRRIQFTPDLMPSDITGTDVLEEEQATGRYSVKFMRGPVFTNFLLADEINRTPPKTQAALLQAMQEREVSIGRETYTLTPPFFVVATQNPIEMEGTYPLPEAQLDRFMFNLRVKYPTVDEEVQIIRGTTSKLTAHAEKVLATDEVLRLQEIVRGVPIADSVIRYTARLVA